MPYRSLEFLVLPTLQNMVVRQAVNFLCQRDPGPICSTELSLTIYAMICSMRTIGSTIITEFGRRLSARMTLEVLPAVPFKFLSSIKARKDRSFLYRMK